MLSARHEARSTSRRSPISSVALDRVDDHGSLEISTADLAVGAVCCKVEDRRGAVSTNPASEAQRLGVQYSRVGQAQSSGSHSREARRQRHLSDLHLPPEAAQSHPRKRRGPVANRRGQLGDLDSSTRVGSTHSLPSSHNIDHTICHGSHRDSWCRSWSSEWNSVHDSRKGRSPSR